VRGETRIACVIVVGKLDFKVSVSGGRGEETVTLGAIG
jgi:hypothetical protein